MLHDDNILIFKDYQATNISFIYISITLLP